jgi:hypothetical protein
LSETNRPSPPSPAPVTAAEVQTRPPNKLIAAYVRAWSEMATVRRDAENQHFGSDYATLEATIKVVKPVFEKHGLALMQIPSEIDAAGNLVITGVLMHESGESLTFRTLVPVGRDMTAQKMGSATTYGRRYQLQAVAGIAPADDDGEAASAPLPKPKQQAKDAPNKPRSYGPTPGSR